ncbi:hypothetical protein LTR53_011269 [Teratosphaeriaceae sp. CCFEE 6253]|nr:hypothetical protein LTR53_011269 [Teratosphaeriaceae sp. CCFEE 6253]
MAVDMNMDVDMDIDLDLGDEMDPELARLQAEAAALEASGNTTHHSATNHATEEAEDGEVNVHAPEPKLHVRGVDNFTPQDVDNYAREHYPDDLFNSVQWIDDSAVNLVYDTELAAAEALQAFTAADVEVADPLELRPAKRLMTHPDVELFVRQATVSDVKVKSAHKYSRFYLDNPRFDPESRPKRRMEERGYRTRDYGNKRRRRDTEDEGTARRASQTEPWDENLYDDDPVSVAARKERRSDSYSSAEQGRKRVRVAEELMPERQNGRLRDRSRVRAEELFPGKQSGRLRDRSASPARSGDGRHGFGEEQPRRRTARPRSPKRGERRSGEWNREARDNLRKELFPNKKTAANGGTALANGHADGVRELMQVDSEPSTPRELFPNHKRHDARDFDREARQVTAGIGRYSLDGSAEERKPRDLMARAKGDSKYGRLDDRPTSAQSNGGGFSIKGAGEGYSFKGASKAATSVGGSASTLPRELFPIKTGGGEGGGRALFEGRIKGKGEQRRRAEDLF